MTPDPTTAAPSLSPRPARLDAVTAQAVVASPLGPLLLARSERGLAGAWFAGQKHHPPQLAVPHRADDALLSAAAGQLVRYFDGGVAAFDLPLDLHGTPFQRAVWAALLAIPHGETCSYRAVAAAVGAPGAVRAVGSAVGRNPVSVIVPCHRVVGSDGTLTGYAGGMDRKRALLTLEKAALGANSDGAASPRASRSLGTASPPTSPLSLFCLA